MANVDVDINEVLIKEEGTIKANGSLQANGDLSSSHIIPTKQFYTTQKDGSVEIQMSGEEGQLTNDPPITVIKFVERACSKFPDRIALRVEREEKWVSWTYQEYLQEIKIVAKAMIKLGLEPYNGVGILGFNSPEWLISDLGAVFAGGLVTGIYTTNNAEACKYVLENATCNIAVVENDVQLKKILEVWDQLPHLKTIVQYTGEVIDKKPNVYNWIEFMEIGRKENEDMLQERINAQSPNKCCTLIYTSGTTGSPKGVMLSHDNIIMGAMAVLLKFGERVDIYGKTPHADRVVSYLPLSHIAAQLLDIYMPIFCGCEVWFAKRDALKGTLVQTLQAARPTLFVGVPRVYEKMEEKLKAVGLTVTGFKKRVSTWAKGVALNGHRNREMGQPLPFGWTIATVILKKVHKALGLDQGKILFTAAAPISKSTCEYFQSLNLPLHEVYGMSESAGMITMCTPDEPRITSIGTISAINEYKVLDPDEDGSGELCYRGRNVFMGYLSNEEKTKETIDEEGWLHTGDIGKIDQDGFFFITGRIKELIITAGGENIAPVPIEENIKEELPLIASAMVIGDKKKFLSCLLTLHVEIDQDTGLPTDTLLPIAKKYCKDLGLEVTKAQEIAPNVPEVLKTAIQEGINNANKKAVSNAAKVQKWKLFPLEFTVTGGELGPTQKLRRPQVVKMYSESIEEFYA